MSICQHNRRRSDCKDCGGTGICQHNRKRSSCKDCGGTGICQHNRQRSTCSPCTCSSGGCVRTSSPPAVLRPQSPAAFAALSPPRPRRLLPPPLLPPRPAAPWRVCYPGPRARRGGPRPPAARARCEPGPPRLRLPAPPLAPLRCAPPPAPPAPPAPPRAASGRLQRAPPTPARTAGTRAPPGCRGPRRRGGTGGRCSGRSGGRARACGALTRRTRGSRRRRHRRGRGRGPGAAGWRGARRTRTWFGSGETAGFVTALSKHLDPDPMGSRVGDPEHCQRNKTTTGSAPVLAEELPAAVLAAQCENGGRAST